MVVLLSVPFLLIVMVVNADNTCEINVLWMRYSTLESQFHHEVHV